MMLSKTLRRRAALRRSRRADPESHFESLEQRMVMYQSPMVTGFLPLSQLEDRGNSVVRILTNVGRIDIELFETLVPTLTANFRSYINNGTLDESFFHSINTTVLQGGGYRFDDISRLSAVPALTPVPNGNTRSNLARTLAMVPINSTQVASQFIINLQDNPALNTQSGGFPVFGKVIQGWDVIQNIQTFATPDLNQQLLGTGTGPFSLVPVTGAYNGTVGPTEATIVKIIDVETIKAPGLPSYYGKEFAYAEGSRSATTTETISMVNEDTSNINYVQVVIRYESGLRDAVIYSGSIAAGARFALTVNDATNPGLNLVRTGEKYSFSVRSTRKMGVAFNHADTGVVLGESFVMTPQVPVGQFKNYQFAQASKSSLHQTLLVVENLGGQNSTVNVNVYTGGAGLMYFAIEIEAFRRGTLDFSTLTNLPDGEFSIWATSLSPFVAAVTQTKTGGGGNASDGSTAQAAQGGGRTEGTLAGAYVATGGEAHIDVLYTGDTSVVLVDFTITLTGGATLNPGTLIMTTADRRKSIDLTTVPTLPLDTFFTIQYSERLGLTPIAVTYRSSIAGDEVSTPFQTSTAENTMFADGFSDPALVGSNGMSETISIFNPYASSGVTFIFDLLFHFSDGTTIFAYAGTPPGFQTLAPLQRRDYRAMSIPVIAAKINSDPAFQRYSIEVISAPIGAASPLAGAVTQITRIQNTLGRAMTSIPSLDPSREIVYMDNPVFN